MSKALEDFIPSLKSIAGQNQLEYIFDNEGDVISYQIEMLSNNRIPGLLKGEVLRIDGKIHLSYDVTSKLPLKKLLERREICRDDFLNILKQIVSLMEMLQEYFLESGGIVFNSNYIFAEPTDLQLEFSYLPVSIETKTFEPLKSFLLDVIINDIKFANEASDNYIQKLIETLKNQDIDINTIRNYLNSTDKRLPEEFHKTPAVTPTAPPVQPKDIKNKEQEAENKPLLIIEKSVLKKETDKVSKLGYPLKSFIILGFVAAAFLLFGIVLAVSGFFSINNPDFLISLFGYLLIGGALIYLVYSKLFTPDKRIGTAPENQDKKLLQPKAKKPELNIPSLRNSFEQENSRIVQKKGSEYINKTFAFPEKPFRTDQAEGASIKQAQAEAPSIQAQHEERAPLRQAETQQKLTNITSQYSDRTVLLSPNAVKYPFLKSTSGEIIILMKFPFMIGRLKEQVDYCLKNPAIGKLHAEIKKTSDGYFINDINTRNGTMVNGERLEPCKDYVLENGARVTFANEEFIFMENSI